MPLALSPFPDAASYTMPSQYPVASPMPPIPDWANKTLPLSPFSNEDASFPAPGTAAFAQAPPPPEQAPAMSGLQLSPFAQLQPQQLLNLWPFGFGGGFQ